MSQPPPGTPPRGERCNTFAVPVTIDINGRAARVEWRGEGPLVPWLVRGHADLWVPVDGTAELFTRFVEYGPQPDMVTNTSNEVGYVVVVSGSSNVGKTTLIHRCVDDLARRIHAAGGRSAPAEGPGQRWRQRTSSLPGIRVIPLGGPENRHGAIGRNSGAPATVEEVNQRILKDVLRFLRRYEAFNAEAGNRLEQPSDIYEAYKELSEVLVSLGWTLLIIVPDLGWRDGRDVTRLFYRSCSDNARTGIVFFLESAGLHAEYDLADEFREEKTHLIHLQVGELSNEDWSRYIRARLVVPDIPGPHVRVAREVIDTPPDRWVYRNVRELQKTLDLIAQQAHRSQEEEIGMDRLDQFLRTHRPDDPLGFRRSG